MTFNLRCAISLLLLLSTSSYAQTTTHAARTTPKVVETSHLVFVKEYVRELISDEELRTSGEKQFNEAKSDSERLLAGIYVSKSVQLELRSQIGVLKDMHLREPFDNLIPTLIASYQRQIDLHQDLINISSKFLAGPKPGVDYSALEAKVPQVRAELENAQKVVFEAAGLVFMTLLDMRPDSQGHVSHLIMTKAEKSDLQDQLDIILKDQSDKGDHDFYISAAIVLRAGLLKGHKCADEPWE